MIFVISPYTRFSSAKFFRSGSSAVMLRQIPASASMNSFTVSPIAGSAIQERLPVREVCTMKSGK